jgi:Tol biopolymer transport system component
MKQRKTTHRLGRACALGFAVLGVLVGCTSRLTVVTEPAGAIVTVSDADGKMLRSGPSPLEADLAFVEDGDKVYRIEVQPTTAQAERFYPAVRQLTTPQYFELPATDNNGKRVELVLREKDYVRIPWVQVLLTPRARWVGVAGRAISYKDIGEEGGRVPQMVVDFGDNRGIAGMALSPDGERIVYAEAIYDRRLDTPDVEGALPGTPQGVYQLKGANLRGINIAGGGVQHITTEDFRDMYPSFTPDGRRILFASNRRGELLGILGIRATGRSGISDIYVNHRNGVLLKPSESADGTMAFAVATLDPTGTAVQDTQVWTNFGPENPFPTQVTTQGGGDPAISPAGDQVAYIAADGNLWVVNVDSSLNTQLTFGAADLVKRYRQKLTGAEQAMFDANAAAGRRTVAAFRDPSWTPDGQYILYTSMEGVDPEGRPNEDIWIIAADGSQKYQLTTNGSVDRYPLMAPEGDHIYFLSNRGESWAVWRVDYGELE